MRKWPCRDGISHSRCTANIRCLDYTQPARQYTLPQNSAARIADRRTNDEWDRLASIQQHSDREENEPQRQSTLAVSDTARLRERSLPRMIMAVSDARAIAGRFDSREVARRERIRNSYFPCQTQPAHDHPTPKPTSRFGSSACSLPAARISWMTIGIVDDTVLP